MYEIDWAKSGQEKFRDDVTLVGDPRATKEFARNSWEHFNGGGWLCRSPTTHPIGQ